MYQLVIGGVEIVKAYGELVDPVEQRVRLSSRPSNDVAVTCRATRTPPDESAPEAAPTPPR